MKSNLHSNQPNESLAEPLGAYGPKFDSESERLLHNQQMRDHIVPITVNGSASMIGIVR